MDVKIRMTEIKPLPEYRQLHRKTTEHTATLSWNYERVQVKQKKQLCLRVTLEEPGGFFLKFLVDETSDVLEGSQEMWDLLCPFRTKE